MFTRIVLTLLLLQVVCSISQSQTTRVPVPKTETQSDLQLEQLKINTPNAAVTCRLTGAFPTRKCKDSDTRDDDVNGFFGTAKNLSYFDQIKSIYNGASSSATVSADLASLNFSNGMQVTAGTNIQAGSTGVTNISAGTIPSLSATAAGQATQNILYGGNIFASGLLPLYSYGASSTGSADGFGFALNLLAREGVDVQSFKAGTSTNASAPPSHSSVQAEGYILYNSTKLGSDLSIFPGAVFAGGSYGYSYTSHGYARSYGFANNVNNGIGQASAGILISGVAKIAISRAFGPSQTYIDSTSMMQTTINNFKAWSFGISYQAPSSKP